MIQTESVYHIYIDHPKIYKNDIRNEITFIKAKLADRKKKGIV